MPDELSLPTSRKRRFPVLVLAVVLAAIAVLVAAIWLLTGQGSRPADVAGAATAEPGAPTSTPDPTASPAPAPTPVTGDLDEDTADVVLANYFQALDTLTEDDDLGDLTTVVAGSAFDELEAQLMEFETREWTITGETRYEDVEIVEADLGSKTPTAILSVCVDSSDVTIVASDGSPVVPAAAGERRALNLYSLTHTDGAWRVVSHSFPDDPQC
jgi:hypothetical protein